MNECVNYFIIEGTIKSVGDKGEEGLSIGIKPTAKNIYHNNLKGEDNIYFFAHLNCKSDSNCDSKSIDCLEIVSEDSLENLLISESLHDVISELFIQQKNVLFYTKKCESRYKVVKVSLE